MTVSVSTNRNEFIGNGSLVAYDYTFVAYSDSSIKIEIDGAEQVSGFTVARNSNNIGGRITFSVAPANGAAIVIRREVPLTQTLDLVRFGRFPAESIERALDEGVMVDQQLQERIDQDRLFTESEVARVLAKVLNRVDGPNNMEQPINMGSNPINNLSDASLDSDAVNLGQAKEISQSSAGRKLVLNSADGFPNPNAYVEGTELKFYDTLDEYVLIRSETGVLQWVEEGNVGDEVDVTAASHLTLAQAQASDLRVGQYVRLTDRGNGLFIVAALGTQANGKDAILMSNNFVLVLIKDSATVDSRWYGTANTLTDNEALQLAINDTSVKYIYVRDYNVASGGCYVDRNDLIIDCCNELLDFTGVGHAAFTLGEAAGGALSAESRVNIEIHNVVTTGNQTNGSSVCFFRKASTCKLVNWRSWWLSTAFGGDGTDATYLSLVCEFKDLDIRYCTVGVNDVAGSFQGSKFIGGRIEANETYGIETNTTNLQILGTVIEGNGRNGGGWDGNGYEIRVGGGGALTIVGGYMERFSTLTNKAFINVVTGSTKRINLIGVDFYGQDAANAHLVSGADWNTGLLNVSGCNINDCSHICTRGGSAGNWHGTFDYFSDIVLTSPAATLNGASYFEIDRVRGVTSTGNMSLGGILTAAATRVTAGNSDSQNTTFQRYIGDIVTGGAGDWHNVIALTDLQAGSGVGNLLDMTFACRQADFRFKVLLDLANATITGTIDFYAGNWTTSNFRIQDGFLQIDNLPASGRDWNAIIVATRTVFS